MPNIKKKNGKVPAFGEGTVGLLSYLINYLHLRAIYFGLRIFHLFRKVVHGLSYSFWIFSARTSWKICAFHWCFRSRKFVTSLSHITFKNVRTSSSTQTYLSLSAIFDITFFLNVCRYIPTASGCVMQMCSCILRILTFLYFIYIYIWGAGFFTMYSNVNFSHPMWTIPTESSCLCRHTRPLYTCCEYLLTLMW